MSLGQAKYCDTHRLPQFYTGLTRPLPQSQHMAYLRHTRKHSPIWQQRETFTSKLHPKHVQIPGNESADDLAKEGTRIEEVEWNITPRISQAIQTINKNIHSKAKDIYQHEGTLSKSITWHSTVTQCAPKVKKEMSRIQHVAIHRLRQGYICSWKKASPPPQKKRNVHPAPGPLTIHCCTIFWNVK